MLMPIASLYLFQYENNDLQNTMESFPFLLFVVAPHGIPKQLQHCAGMQGTTAADGLHSLFSLCVSGTLDSFFRFLY